MAAVCASNLAMAVTEITDDISYYSDSELTVNSNLLYDGCFSWNASGGTMSGNGSISASEYQGVEIGISGVGSNESRFVINKGVNIENAYMYFYAHVSQSFSGRSKVISLFLQAQK